MPELRPTDKKRIALRLAADYYRERAATGDPEVATWLESVADRIPGRHGRIPRTTPAELAAASQVAAAVTGVPL